MEALTLEEVRRYDRQIRLPEIGREGQTKLKNARVLCIGAGGLGSPILLYLAAAGVGHIGIVDHDTVDESNLQRQILHNQNTLKTLKVESAEATLLELNPNVNITTYAEPFKAELAKRIVPEYDLLIDGTDNFASRFLTNDAAYFFKKPWVYGAIHQFTGQIGVFTPADNTGCYRCIMPEMPDPSSVPSCAEAGVLGALPGVIGSMQALEALKILTNTGTPLVGKWILYDGLNGTTKTIKLPHDPDCPLCGSNPSIEKIEDETWQCSSSNENATMESITAAELKAKLDSGENLTLIDVRTPMEWEEFHLESAQLFVLQELPQTASKLPKDETLYITCKAGMRSARAIEYLNSLGYEKLVNVSDGMDGYLMLG